METGTRGARARKGHGHLSDVALATPARATACPRTPSVVPGLPREGASAGRALVDSTQDGQLGTPSQPSW